MGEEAEEYYIGRLRKKPGRMGTASYYLLIPKDMVNIYRYKPGEAFMIIPKNKDEWIIKRIKPE